MGARTPPKGRGGTPAALLAAVLAMTAGAAAARAEGYRHSRLALPGAVSDWTIADLNGDGRGDLLITAIQQRGLENLRSVNVFLQQPGGAFGEQPDQRLMIGPEVAALLVADVAAEPGPELVLIERFRMLYHPRAGAAARPSPDSGRTGREQSPAPTGRTDDAPPPGGPSVRPEPVEEPALSVPKGRTAPPAPPAKGAVFGTEGRPLLRARSFFDFPSATSLPFLPAVGDLDGNGREDLLVPQPANYLCFFQSPERDFRRFQVFAVEPGSDLDTSPDALIEAGRSLPALHGADFDGDGRRDFLTLSHDTLLVFLQHGDGTFDQNPSLRLPLDFLKQDFAEGTRDQFDAKRLEIADLDGDRKVDLLVVRNRGEVGLFSSFKTEVLIFRGTGANFGRRGPDETRVPHQILRFDGLGADLDTVDLDGDGDLDLAFTVARVDLLSLGAQALADEVSLDARLFLYDKAAGLYQARDAYEERVSIPKKYFDLSRRTQGAPLVRFEWDFDGDGKADRLEYRPAGDDRLEVVGTVNTARGADGTPAFGREPRYRFAITPTWRLHPVDFNGDRRMDLLTVVDSAVEVEVSR